MKTNCKLNEIVMNAKAASALEGFNFSEKEKEILAQALGVSPDEDYQVTKTHKISVYSEIKYFNKKTNEQINFLNHDTSTLFMFQDDFVVPNIRKLPAPGFFKFSFNDKTLEFAFERTGYKYDNGNVHFLGNIISDLSTVEGMPVSEIDFDKISAEFLSSVTKIEQVFEYDDTVKEEEKNVYAEIISLCFYDANKDEAYIVDSSILEDFNRREKADE